MDSSGRKAHSVPEPPHQGYLAGEFSFLISRKRKILKTALKGGGKPLGFLQRNKSMVGLIFLYLMLKFRDIETTPSLVSGGKNTLSCE